VKLIAFFLLIVWVLTFRVMILRRNSFIESLIHSIVFTCFGLLVFWIIEHFNFSKMAAYALIGGLIILMCIVETLFEKRYKRSDD
jgi:uncharacterized BrkB/YihY/UPF0761 family membrane protein